MLHLDFFNELGNLNEHQCKTIKHMVFGDYHNYHVKWANYAGNYTILATTSYQGVTVNEAKHHFLYKLVMQGIEAFDKADFLHRLCMVRAKQPNALICKHGVHEYDPNGDYYFLYQDAEKAREFCPSAHMSMLEDGTNMAYVPYKAFHEELSPNALKAGMEIVILEP